MNDINEMYEMVNKYLIYLEDHVNKTGLDESIHEDVRKYRQDLKRQVRIIKINYLFNK